MQPLSVGEDRGERMKIQRVNAVIPTAQNKHFKYLYNNCLDLMSKHHFGGEFKNDTIKLNSMPESVLRILQELKIKFDIK